MISNNKIFWEEEAGKGSTRSTYSNQEYPEEDNEWKQTQDGKYIKISTIMQQPGQIGSSVSASYKMYKIMWEKWKW